MNTNKKAMGYLINDDLLCRACARDADIIGLPETEPLTDVSFLDQCNDCECYLRGGGYFGQTNLMAWDVLDVP